MAEQKVAGEPHELIADSKIHLAVYLLILLSFSLVVLNVANARKIKKLHSKVKILETDLEKIQTESPIQPDLAPNYDDYDDYEESTTDPKPAW